MVRALFWALVSSLSMLLLALLGSSWLLLTEPGGRWVLEQVPGLEVRDFEGVLARRWRAERLLYSDGAGTRLMLEAPVLAWRPVCLLWAAVCVDQLGSDRIDLSLPDPQEPDASDAGTPIELPEASTALSIQVSGLDLGRVTVNGNLILDRLRFAGEFAGSRLRVTALSLARQELEAGLAGSVRTTGQWPLDAELDLQYRLSQGDYPGMLDLTAGLEGTVSELSLDAAMTTPWQATLAGVVRPLDPGVPADLRLSSGRFRATPDLRETLILNNVVINARGNLDQGWRVHGDADVNTTPALPLSVAGHVDLEGADVDRISLRDGADRYLLLEQGSVSWTEGLMLSGSLDWSYFPWLRLMPDLDPPPAVVEQAGLEFKLKGSAYEGQLAARLSTPAGPVALNTAMAGDSGGVRLSDLALASADGRAHGNGTLDWRDGLAWDASLDLAGLSPERWLAELPADLSGTLRSTGHMGGDSRRMEADLRLAGSLRGQALLLNSKARLEDEHWRVPTLDLSVGDNRLQANLARSQTLDVSVDLDLAALEQLWPDLAGHAQARMQATDLMGDAEAELALEVGSLVLGQPEFSLESASASASLSEALSGKGHLQWQSLEFAGQHIESGDFRIAGDRDSHSLGLSVRHREARVRLSADGAWTGRRWQGRVDGGGVSVRNQHWLMDSPARLVVDAGGNVDLGAHCWGWQRAQLCAGEQRLYPEQRLDLALSDYPTEALAPWLPLDLRWRDTLNGAVRVSVTESGPSGSLWVDVGSGTVELRRIIDPDDLDAGDSAGTADSGEIWVPLDYDRFRIAASLEQDEARLDIDLSGPELGQAHSRLLLDPHQSGYPVSGDVTVEQLDLALVRPFLDLDVVEGRLRGSLDLAGPLVSPDVQGRLALSEGRIQDPRLPIALDGIVLEALIDGRRADFEGQWRSGDRGEGTLTGSASWDGAPVADLSLKGEELPVAVEPFARLTVFPDLQLHYDRQGLRIGGRVEVPGGEVTIKSLPETAVGVSDDEVIVGRETESSAMALGMDLVVVIGGGRVDFNGFGVTGVLDGRIRLLDDMIANGELNLREGRYQLYGQDLTIRRAQLLFSGPLDRPFLDIEAVRVVGEVTAGVRLTGPADEPRAEIFSEPAMGEQQALSYLVLGRPFQSEADSRSMERAAIGLGLAQAAPMTRKIGEKVGIEGLQLETEGQGEETSVVASGYITDRLSLRYGVGLFQPVSQLALRYDLTQRIFLEAASGLTSSLDIFYRREFGKPGD